jgi:hypothetical protein
MSATADHGPHEAARDTRTRRALRGTLCGELQEIGKLVNLAANTG